MRRIERRYHLKWTGVVYFVAAALLGLGAFNSQNNLLFILLGVSLSAVVVSGLISGPMMYRLRVERDPPPEMRVGEPSRLGYRLTQTGKLIAGFALTVEEVESAGIGRRATWVGALTPPRAFAPHVPCGRSLHLWGEVIPLRRGVFRFEGVRVSSAFPSGLFRKSVSQRDRSEVLIRPRIVPLRADRLRAVMSRGGSDRTTRGAQRHGAEFFGVRPYAAGDSPRQIAWKASARTGVMVSKEHAAQAAGRLTVVLVLEGTPASRDADERAIMLAASVIELARRSAMAVGLQAPGAGLSLRAAGHERHASMLHEALARIDLDRISPEANAQAPPPRSAVVVVCGRRSADSTLRGRGALLVADELEEVTGVHPFHEHHDPLPAAHRAARLRGDPRQDRDAAESSGSVEAVGTVTQPRSGGGA